MFTNRIPPPVRIFALLLPLVLLATSCIESLEPDGVTNVVGASHTVTLTTGVTTTQVRGAQLQSIINSQQVKPLQEIPTAFHITFEVLSGPNAGKHSTNDCVPGCDIPTDVNEVSWTYTGTGGPGTDVIRGCVLPPNTTLSDTLLLLEQEILSSNFSSVEEFLTLLNETFDTEFDSIQDLVCLEVTKIWVEPTPVPQQERPRNNTGGAIGAVAAAAGEQARDNRATVTAGAAAPTVAVQAPRTGTGVVLPPNTGSGGLK
jgi:hypothetical protein